MAQVSITELPQAQTLQGIEAVPIVQNGVTVQTTTGAIAGAAALNYPFITFGSTAGLTQARQLTLGSGLSFNDGGIGGALQINLTGAAQSLDGSSTGLQVKTGPNTVTGRTFGVGTGLSITNADGVAGNPSISLGTYLQQLVSLTGTGILALQSGTPAKITLQGTTNQISIANGDGASNPVISLATNTIIPGTGSVTVPSGTTVQRVGSAGAVRYNTNLQQFEGYTSTGWNQFSLTGGVTSFSAGTTGFTPNTDTTGAVTLAGILNPANGGTGAATLTGYVYGNGTGVMTASTTIPNAGLANSSITINGSSVSLGGSITVTATASNALTIGTGLTGTSYNGSAPVTITIDSTVATLTGSQTLTNKSISGSTNTLTNIPNSALTNSSITLGTTTIALGGSSLTPAGLTSVTVTQDPTTALQLATKQYVDSVAQGLNVKTSVAWGTTANITLSGLATQAGGEWTGTLTAGDRILVKNQSTAANNGIYAAAAGAWTRTADADTWNELVSAFVFVQQGATLGDTGWVCTVDPGGTLGVTAVTWAQFSGAGTYTAGTGLTLTGTQFSLTSPVSASLGGTGVTTLTGIAYGNATSAFTAATAAQVVSVIGTTAVTNATNATNATNTGITATTTGATNYLTFVTATTGNLPQLVNSSITANAVNGTITGGIAGGAF